MYELITPVTTKKVRAMCGCQDGAEYQFTGETLMSDPPQHIHECKCCGKRENLQQVHPYIDFREDKP